MLAHEAAMELIGEESEATLKRKNKLGVTKVEQEYVYNFNRHCQ